METLKTNDRVLLIAILVAMAIGLVVQGYFALTENLTGIATGVVAYSVMATVAAALSWRSARRSEGPEAKAWRSFAYGFAAWTFSGALVLGYLFTGGGVFEIPSWTQVGYLLAYPFFFRGLWALRQPTLADSLGHRLLLVGSELVVLGLIALVLGAVIWNPAVAADVNISFLIPPTLDVLLFGLFYNAVRRSGIARGGALAWMGYAFGALAGADVVVTYFVLRDPSAWAILALSGYIAAMGLAAVAATRRFRVAESQHGFALSHSSIVAGGLVLAGVAVALLPGDLRIVAGAAGVFLAWRTFSAIRESSQDNMDGSSGFLSQAAFSRQLDRAASSGQNTTLIGIDLTGFGVWNARNGFAEGDEMLDRVTRSLDAAFTTGVWGRIGADRFAHLSPAAELQDERNTAEMLRRRASEAARELPVRAGLVSIPGDSQSAGAALSALDETLFAAREAGREVVAYGGGDLDGIEIADGASTLADRRARIQSLMETPESIRPVFQPIVRMTDLEVIGFEGLSRFHAEPNRGPDRWIAEAHSVGLGIDIELECVRRIVAEAQGHGTGQHVSINASPALVFSNKFEKALGEGSLDWLTIEITEHDEVENYSQLAERLGVFRGRGASVAVDDAGAGHSSLRHVMQLRPEWVKLDRSLIQEMDRDPGKRALVRSMVAYNEEIGSTLVAEGVETQAEMNALLEVGVSVAQGYLFARPNSEFVLTLPPRSELAAN